MALTPSGMQRQLQVVAQNCGSCGRLTADERSVAGDLLALAVLPTPPVTRCAPTRRYHRIASVVYLPTVVLARGVPDECGSVPCLRVRGYALATIYSAGQL